MKSAKKNLRAGVERLLKEALDVKLALIQTQIEVIEEMAAVLLKAVKVGHTIYFIGNGGSAADAQHLEAELLGRFLRERAPIPARALTTNTSLLSAIGNDYGFEEVFVRQARACLKPGDVLVALTTSGNSPNILKAVEYARTQKVKVLGFTGESGGKLAPLADVCLRVPSSKTYQIQECHITVGHLLCALVEESVAG